MEHSPLVWVAVLTLSAATALLVPGLVRLVRLLLAEGVPVLKDRTHFLVYMTASLVLCGMSVGASFMLEIPFVTVPVCVVAGSLVASIFFLITRVMVACEEKLKYALQDHVKAQTKIEKMQEALDSSKQALSTVRSELATSVQNLGKAREELAQKSHPQTERRSADVHDISTRIAETTG